MKNADISLFFTEDIYYVIEKKSLSSSNIYNTPAQEPTPATLAEDTLPIYKKCVLLSDIDLDVPQNSPLKIFAEKIVGAMKWSLKDVYFAKAEEKTNLINSTGYQYLISFGVVLDTIDLAPYIIAENQNRKMLLADSLSILVENVEKKRLLWNNLQVFFPQTI